MQECHQVATTVCNPQFFLVKRFLTTGYYKVMLNVGTLVFHFSFAIICSAAEHGATMKTKALTQTS